jgi:hypothetical protein
LPVSNLLGLAVKRIALSLHDQTIELRDAAGVGDDLEILFGAVKADIAESGESESGESGSRVSKPRPVVRIAREPGGGYALEPAGGSAETGLDRDDLLNLLQEQVVHALIVDMASAVVLHAGAVSANGRAMLLAGPTGSGKTSLAAWFVANGFRYLSDEVVALVEGGTDVVGFPRAMVVKGEAAVKIEALAAFAAAGTVQTAHSFMISPAAEQVAPHVPARCGLIVFPQFEAGAPLRIAGITAAQAGLRLMGCNLNARNLPGAGFSGIGALARAAPAFVLHYGDFDQLGGIVDVLARLLLDAEHAPRDPRRFLSAFSQGAAAVPSQPTAEPACEILAPTPHRPARKLTIGMATYDDYDGVYFTVQALRLYHPEILDDTNFVVIDNHPDGRCAAPLKQLDTLIPNYRYVPTASRSGTAVRDVVFEEADSEFVLCMDCHVFIVSGAIKRLLGYLEANPHTRDLLQGPLLYDDLAKTGSHFHPAWRAGMYGYWESDPRADDPDGAPFDIPMHGLGLFACRRAAWPGFNPQFRGFGGEEGYIHEKFRRAGGRTLCLPFLRWIHRFNRPLGPPYRNTWDDRIRNYLIGFREIGWPTEPIAEHFRELLGREPADRILATVEAEFADA